MRSALRIPGIIERLWRVLLNRKLVAASVAALVMIAVIWLTVEILKRRKQRLTYLISAEKRRIMGYRFYEPLFSTFCGIYDPSPTSLGIVAAVVLIIWAMVLRFAGSPGTGELQSVSGMQRLETGIALIFVPFTLFAVGLSSRRTDAGVSAAEVLLRETWIFPITVFVLGLLTTFALVRRSSVAVAVIIVTLALAVFAIYRLCRVLLDEQYLYSSGIKLLQDKIRRTIGGALDERIGNNILLKWLEDKPIEYSLGSGARAEANFTVAAASRGVVQDVHLDRLSLFAEDLEGAANESGFAFGEKQRPGGLEFREERQQPSEVERRELTPQRGRYILKLFGQPVADRSDALISFPRSLVPSPGKREQLAKRARGAFRIRPGDAYSQRVERYLNQIKDEAVAAIKDRRTAHLDSILTVFSELVTTFLEEMKRAIGGHSYEAAVAESSSLLGGWNEMRWMFRHLFEIHDRGCRSEDPYIVRAVTSLPARVAYSSIQFGDNLVFDQFTALVQRQYSAIDNAQNQTIKKLLYDTCNQHLSDLANVGIALELQNPENTAGHIEKVGSLATVLLVRFWELMKLAVDKSQFQQFRDFNLATNGLLGRVGERIGFQPAVGHPTKVQSSPEDRASAIRHEERRRAVIAVVDRIERQKNESLFAIGSYVFEKALSADDPALRQCLHDIDAQLPTNPEDQAELYLTARGPEGAQVWERAMIADAPEGRWGDANFVNYLCYLLLKSTHQYNEQQFAAIDLPQNPDFVLSLRQDGPIGSAIAGFAADRKQWGKLIPDEWLEAIPKIRTAFDRALAEHTRTEEQLVIAAPIDRDYVKDFKARFAKEFKEHAALRNLLQHFEAYRDNSAAGPSLAIGQRWGLSLIDFKEAYTVEGRNTFFDWPEEYARKLATSESEAAFRQTLEQLTECELDGIHGLQARIEGITGALEAGNFQPTAVFVARQSPLAFASSTLGSFTPYWLASSPHKRTPEFLGEIGLGGRRVPVFAIWTAQDPNMGFAVQLPEALVWEQLPPADSLDEISHVQGQFFIHLVDFSADASARKELIKADPDWLKPHADKDRYLSLRVWLKVLERFRLQVIDRNRGLKFNLSD